MKAIVACATCSAGALLAIVILIGFVADSLKNGATMKSQFNDTTILFSKRIDETLNKSVELLSMVVSLASVVPRLDNRTMVEFLDSYLNHSHSTTSTIIWAEAIQNITLQESIMRAEGFTNYNVTASASGSKKDMLPLTYVYPYVFNFSLRGFDLFSDPMRQQSLIKANETRLITATPAISGITNNTVLRISIYDPVFYMSKRCLKGVVYQNFFVDMFIINSLQDINNSTLEIKWKDLTDDASTLKMYHLNENAEEIGSLYFEKQINFAGRKWLLELRNVIVITEQQKITTGVVIAALLLIGIIIVIVTANFIKIRLNLKKQKRAAKLLSLVVPDHITAQLTDHVVTLPGGKKTLKGETLIAETHRRVGLCFIDICNFTIISSALTPTSLVQMLNEFFTLIDEIVDKHSEIKKIKTIGDAYFAVSGLSTFEKPLSAKIINHDKNDSKNSSDATNLLSLIDFCVSVQEKLQNHRFKIVQSQEYVEKRKNGICESSTEEARCMAVLDDLFAASNEFIRIQVRIGVHVGDIVAGVVGKKQPQYDVWGNACNVAARMESTAQFGQIQVSQQVVDSLHSCGYKELFILEKRRVSLKGIGRVDAFSLQLDHEQVRSIIAEAK